MNPLRRSLPLGFALIFCWTGLLFANYTIVLKNGRRITVKTYREEGEMIKVRGMGGEFGIAKDQIESIIKPEGDEERGMVVPETQQSYGGANRQAVQRSSRRRVEGKVQDNKAKEQREGVPQAKVDEEREYRSRIKQITDQIKGLTDRYSIATRGSTGPQPGILDSQAAIKARTADLQSRLKDAQRSRAGSGKAAGGIPRVNVPLPAYSAKEKELSDLRRQIIQLHKERETLIQEMNKKDLDTTAVPQ